ncbi:MAG: efflux RND transporter periplasmic adaptor subunit [Planctomycetaceae bacterium]|nr:efflux RND transporter periplasmic adaptor subunit [Planctomycetaceae bacterium]
MKKVVLIFVLAIGVGGYCFLRYHFAEKFLEEQDVMTLYGNVEIRRVHLGFRVSGRVQEILFQEGDKIAKNELIACLDKEPYQDNLAIADAQVRKAKANLEKLETGNRPQEIEQARATLKERDATLKVLNANAERAKRLIESKAIAQEEYDTTIAQRDEAAARKKLAEETLNLLLEGFRQEDIEAGKAQLDEAEANLKRSQTSLNDAELRSPNDGILLTRVEEPGAVVNPGQTIITLSLRDGVWIYVYVPESQIGQVVAGMKAEIYTDSQPDKPYAGQVGYKSPEAEFTPKTVQTTELRTDLVYRVRIIADNPDEHLCQGMPVTVKLKLK